MDMSDYNKYVEQLRGAKTIDEIQALAPTNFETTAGLADWEKRRTGALDAVTQQSAKPYYPAMVDYAQATGTTDPRFTDPESKAVLNQQGVTGNIGPFANPPSDPGAAAALAGLADKAQTEGNLRDYISGEASPNVLAQLAASDNTKSHMAAIQGLATGYQARQGTAPPSLEERKYADTKAATAAQAGFQNDITGIAGYSQAAQPLRFNESPIPGAPLIPVIPTGPNVNPVNGLDYSDANGNPTKPVLRPLAEVQDLTRQAAAARGVDPKDALSEVVKLYEANRTDAQGIPSALTWAGKEETQSDNQLYAAAQRGDKGAQAILAAKQGDAVRVAKEKGDNARTTIVNNPLPAKTSMQINGLTPEENAALDRAITNGLDPYKVNSRTGKIYAQQEMLNPGRKWNDLAASAQFDRNAGVMNTKALLNTINPLLDNLVSSGSVLGNGKFPLINKVVNATKEATGNADIVGFNNLRDDVVAEVERGLLGSGVLSDSKYTRAIKNINSAQSMPQLKAAVDNTKLVIKTRLESLAAGPNGRTGATPKNDGRPVAPAGIKAKIGNKVVTSDGKGGWN